MAVVFWGGMRRAPPAPHTRRLTASVPVAWRQQWRCVCGTAAAPNARVCWVGEAVARPFRHVDADSPPFPPLPTHPDSFYPSFVPVTTGADAAWPPASLDKPCAATTLAPAAPAPHAPARPPRRAAALAAARVVHDALADADELASGSSDGRRGARRRGTARGAPAPPSTPRPVSPAVAAIEAARAGAPAPALPPLRKGVRKAVDVDGIEDPGARRKARRLAKNRETAAASRERRRAQMQELVDRVHALESEAAALRGELQAARAEAAALSNGGGGAGAAAARAPSLAVTDSQLLPAGLFGNGADLLWPADAA